MELEKIARDVAKHYHILLERQEGSMIGTNMNEFIIYSSTLFPKDNITYDVLIVNKDNAKMILTQIYGSKEKKEIQFFTSSKNLINYIFNFRRCPAPYNNIAELIEKQNSSLKSRSIKGVRMELENFDNVYNIIIKVL